MPRTWIGKVERRDRRLDVLETYRLLKAYGMWPAAIERLLARGKRP